MPRFKLTNLVDYIVYKHILIIITSEEKQKRENTRLSTKFSFILTALTLFIKTLNVKLW